MSTQIVFYVMIMICSTLTSDVEEEIETIVFPEDSPKKVPIIHKRTDAFDITLEVEEDTKND